MCLISRVTRFATLSAITGAALALSIAGSTAEPMPSEFALKRDGRPGYAKVGRETNAPIGWIDHCITYASECAHVYKARDIVLTVQAWKDLEEVNRWVNSTIMPESDLDHWGEVERWDMAEDGFGDCEDYVLLKRSLLMQANWPQEALLVTVVLDKKGDNHAVLTVKTDLGQYILDNVQPKVLIWYRTGYSFMKRQSQFNRNIWIMLEEPALVSSLDTIDRIRAAKASDKSVGTLFDVTATIPNAQVTANR